MTFAQLKHDTDKDACAEPDLVAILLHESLVELLQLPNILLNTRTKACKPKVRLMSLLPEPTPAHSTNARRVQQRKRIERIRLLARLLRRLYLLEHILELHRGAKRGHPVESGVSACCEVCRRTGMTRTFR